MDKLAVCRICLANNMPMRLIVNKSLLEMYSTLTKIPFVTDDNKPMLVCYICCARLHNSYKLAKTCLWSKELLHQVPSTDGSSSDPLEQFRSSRRFGITQAVQTSYSPEIQHKDTHVEGHGAQYYDVEVKVEVTEDMTTETSEKNDFKLKVSEQCCGTMYSEGPTIQIENKTINENEMENFTNCIKTEPSDEQEDFDDIIRFSDTEHVSAPIHELSQDIPINLMEIDLQNCGDKTTKEFNKCSEKHKAKKPYECNLCYKSFNLKRHLECHVRTHTGEKPFECDVCKKSFNEKCALVVHSRTHTESKPFACEICKRGFNQKVHLLGHLRTHIGERPFICDICKKSFSLKSILKRHARTHTENKPFECDVCKKRFTQKSNLLQHTRIHTGEKSSVATHKALKCEKCNLFFCGPKNLDRHFTRKHAAKILYTCDICKKSFHIKNRLIRHIRSHTGEKPFECDLCKKRFSEKSNLLQHTRIHTGEKSFECDVCKKSFNSKSNLDRHKRHGKMLKCDLCDKHFCYESDLVRHSSMHNGVSCEVCKKFFRRKKNLDAHARTHTKAFQCYVCKKHFTHNSKLTKHFRSHAHTHFK